MKQIFIEQLLADGEMPERKPDINKYDLGLERKIKARWDQVAKPLDGMGAFEELLSRIGAIQGMICPDLEKAAVLIMCADNGVVKEGVSQSPQEVTALCAKNIASLKSCVGIMARSVGAQLVTVDVGMNTKEKIKDVIDKKIMEGTNDFLEKEAMSEKEALKAIQTGMDLVKTMKEQGFQILLTGEMGIGNTTTSSAMASVLLDLAASAVTGRGAGLSDEGLSRKVQVIEEAIEKYKLRDHKTALEILCAVGGLDIAALMGICIGGAIYQVPILLDGMISMVSALAAEKLIPGIKEYLIPSHTSKEPAAKLIQEMLNIHPVIDASMALGEGTGAVMMLSLLKTANEVYKNSFSFEEYGLKQYDRMK